MADCLICEKGDFQKKDELNEWTITLLKSFFYQKIAMLRKSRNSTTYSSAKSIENKKVLYKLKLMHDDDRVAKGIAV
jgi:hypothetical protein